MSTPSEIALLREANYALLRDQLYSLTDALDMSVEQEDHFRGRVRCYLAMHEAALALGQHDGAAGEGQRVLALIDQVEAGNFDELDAAADRWAAEASVQRMANAMASVFENHASQEIMDRFREKLAALMHLAFVEGAAQGVLQLRAAATPSGAQTVTEKEPLMEEAERVPSAEEVEAVAKVLDPGVWDDDLPMPTRAATLAFHAGRQASCALARAAIIRLDQVRGK